MFLLARRSERKYLANSLQQIPREFLLRLRSERERNREPPLPPLDLSLQMCQHFSLCHCFLLLLLCLFFSQQLALHLQDRLRIKEERKLPICPGIHFGSDLLFFALKLLETLSHPGKPGNVPASRLHDALLLLTHCLHLRLPLARQGLLLP